VLRQGRVANIGLLFHLDGCCAWRLRVYFFFRNLEKFDVREADISKKEQGEKPCSENRVDPIFPKFESDLD
jgi:hypothetical protein